MFSSNTSQAQESQTYVDDVFSTYLYTGNGTTQTITNGIDLAGKGGMVWTKCRTGSFDNAITDSSRYLFTPQQWYRALNTNSTAAEWGGPGTTVNGTGYSLTGDFGSWWNESGYNYVSWTFRKAAKFFDVVTFTVSGSSSGSFSHNLGSTPGCVILKNTTSAEDWWVYHRSLSSGYFIRLNTTGAQSNAFTIVSSVSSTSVSYDNLTIGSTYVAYLFAHDTSSTGLIQCGSVTASSGVGSVTLGWEPQFVLLKPSTSTGAWTMHDNMRGMPVTQTNQVLQPNSSAAEYTDTGSTEACVTPNATGFTINVAHWDTYIYIAIRRPNKPPTSGTQVFSPQTTSSATGTSVTTSFPVDLQAVHYRLGVDNVYFVDRLRGVNSPGLSAATPFLLSDNTNAETTSTTATNSWDNTGYKIPGLFGGASYAYWNFKRAPGFFDVVCYTGTGSATTQAHNLAVVPELMIVKNRLSALHSWAVAQVPAAKYIELNKNIATYNYLPYAFGNGSVFVSPTASVFTVGSEQETNATGYKYVAYLFATLAGISKVGSYTGTGSTQTIDCGFTGGARFVLVKRTDSTGDWYVWDTARGMVSGTDPSLLLNSTAAEVNANSIYTTTGGFQIVSTDAGINASGGFYIYLAIS